MKTLIAIATYNGEKYISNCLNSIPNSPDVQIYIFDNNSTDSTLQLIKQSKKNITLIESDVNLGFGGANNEMINYAIINKFDFIFLMNQDTYFLKNCLENLLSIAQTKEKLYIYSPLHLASDGKTLDQNFANYIEDLNLDSKHSFEAAFVNAAAWLIPIKTLKKVGGFCPDFFHYGEDRNYAQRLKYFGGQFLIIPQAKLIHDRTVTSYTELAAIDLMKFKQRIRVYLKCFILDVNSNGIVSFLTTTKTLLGLIKNNLFSLSPLSILKIIQAYFEVVLRIRTNYKTRSACKRIGAYSIIAV